MATTLHLQIEEDRATVTIMNEALERFAADLIAASEVMNFLLDLRSAVVSDAAIAALIKSEAQPTH